MALPYRVTGDVATSLCPSLVPPPPMPLMSPASFADEVQIEEECLLRLLVAHYHGHLHAADCVPHGCGYLTVRGRGDAHQSRGGACVCVCACTLRDQSRVLEGMSAGEGGLRRAESSSQAVAGASQPWLPPPFPWILGSRLSVNTRRIADLRSTSSSARSSARSACASQMSHTCAPSQHKSSASYSDGRQSAGRTLSFVNEAL